LAGRPAAVLVGHAGRERHAGLERATDNTIMRRFLIPVAVITLSLCACGAVATIAHDKPVSLSAQQLAGQRVIFSYRGLTPPASLVAQIKAGEVAGVIFFSDNIASELQIKQVIAQLQRDAAASPLRLPLLMMTDQEGGQVRRLPGAPVLSEKLIGQAAVPAAIAAAAGHGAGVNLRGVGINANLAPVLDVYRRTGNFIDMYGRSYSSNPAAVATLGANFIKAQQQTGIVATAKHFPGLGAAATGQNTDLGPVTLTLSAASLRAIDEVPYRSAILAGVKMVMASWAVYPSLDPSHPAGMSTTVVQGELRARLGFKGVTITDALEAGALRAYGPTANRAVLAARAGMDLILCSSGRPTQGTQAVAALAAALNAGRLSKSAFNASVGRILALRRTIHT
jgi:beta-N-acetylhexosaminidase